MFTCNLCNEHYSEEDNIIYMFIIKSLEFRQYNLHVYNKVT